MFEENLLEYESLRNEIIATQGTRANLIVYMYSIYAVLFGFGIQFSKIYFVVTLVLLISFQAKINRCKFIIQKISTYIRVFFEKEMVGMNWESSNIHEAVLPVLRERDCSFTSILSGTSSVQLGLLSFVCYTGCTLYSYWHGIGISVTDMILIAVSIVGIVILQKINNEYRKMKSDNLEKAYMKLKSDLKSKQMKAEER